MKPITEDQVSSLMEGLETREKRAMKRLSDAVSNSSRHSGRATARILKFGRPASSSFKKLVSADVIALSKERAEKAAKSTAHGRFLYLVPTHTR